MGLFSSLVPGGFSGGEVGNSASQNITTNADGRVVGGNNSSNISTVVTGSNNTLTDQGAVQGGLRLALAGIESATGLARQAQESQGGILTGALRMAGEQQEKFTTALENIKTSDVRVLIIAGIAAVVIVGAMALRRG